LYLGQVELDSKRTKRNCKPVHLGKLSNPPPSQPLSSRSPYPPAQTPAPALERLRPAQTPSSNAPAVPAALSAAAAAAAARASDRTPAARGHAAPPEINSARRPPLPPHSSAAAAADPAGGSDSDVDFEADPAYQHCGGPAVPRSGRSAAGPPPDPAEQDAFRRRLQDALEVRCAAAAARAPPIAPPPLTTAAPPLDTARRRETLSQFAQSAVPATLKRWLL
jgi:hypothetical protein